MILEVLQSGPKSYSELPKSPALDLILDSLLKQRRIIHSYDSRGTHRYSLPVEITDEPIQKPAGKKQVGTRICKSCQRRKRKDWFFYGGVDNLICQGCFRDKVPPKLPNRPTCIKCKKRRVYSHFVYDGVPHLTCRDCR